MKIRLLKAALKFLVALVVVAVAAAGYLFYRAMPAYSGSVALPGLSAEARVWRDGYGAPHIFAANLDDAARALGYLHASERLYQMEINRRAGQGRVAEIAGADLVGVDRFVRTLGLYPASAKQLRRAVAVGAAAAAGLCRRRQRLPRQPPQRAAARIPHPRRQARTVDARQLAGLGQADVAAAQRQLPARELARAPGAEAARRSRRLAVPGAEAGLAGHHGAGRPSPTTPASTTRASGSARCCR